jgi:hypothetical protein
MLHKEFWGLLFIGFVVWMMAAATPGLRIENGCRPVGWTGNVVTSLSALVLPAQQTKVQGWFDKLEYGCRYTAWRLFYQEAYNKWKNANDSAIIAPAIALGSADKESAAPAKPASAASSAAAAASAPDSSVK